MLAASNGGYENAATVKLLLNRGAEIGARNEHGQTALEVALKNHRSETVPALKKGYGIRSPINLISSSLPKARGENAKSESQ